MREHARSSNFCVSGLDAARECILPEHMSLKYFAEGSNTHGSIFGGIFHRQFHLVSCARYCDITRNIFRPATMHNDAVTKRLIRDEYKSPTAIRSNLSSLQSDAF